jgi:hypothetical protein
MCWDWFFPNIDKGHDCSKNNLLPDFRIVRA